MTGPSYELYKANQQLLARRAALQKERQQPIPHPSLASKHPHTPVTPNAAQRNEKSSNWQPPAAFTLPRSLCAAVLQRKVTAPARLWLLLRTLDKDGRGWLPLEAVRENVTSESSPMRLCSPRHLRTLLNQGEGYFWERKNGRLWLRSTAKLAAALGIEKFRGPDIELPHNTLTGPIGRFRAQLYAAFHSGQKANNHQSPIAQLPNYKLDTVQPITQSPPISRATLTTITGLSRRTQHAYERRANITVRPNYALGPRCTARDSVHCTTLKQSIPRAGVYCATFQEFAWQRGTAVFPFRDHQGQHGRKGTTYIAWQLPNSYHTPHKIKGRSRRLNRKLADLRKKRDAGNGRLSPGALHAQACVAPPPPGRDGALHAQACVAPPPPTPQPLYHHNPAALAKALNRRDVKEGYWPSNNGRLWYWVGVGQAGKNQEKT